jgi:hypothetical protein
MHARVRRHGDAHSMNETPTRRDRQRQPAPPRTPRPGLKSSRLAPALALPLGSPGRSPSSRRPSPRSSGSRSVPSETSLSQVPPKSGARRAEDDGRVRCTRVPGGAPPCQPTRLPSSGAHRNCTPLRVARSRLTVGASAPLLCQAGATFRGRRLPRACRAMPADQWPMRDCMRWLGR